jgi:hypothetical protein
VPLESVDDGARGYRVRFSLLSVDGPNATLGPFERDDAYIGVLIETRGILLMGFLVVGRATLRVGENGLLSLTVLTEHPELLAGDVISISDGSRQIGSATILAPAEPRQGSAMHDR